MGDDFIYSNEDRLLVTLLIINVAFAMFTVGAAGRSRTWDERSYVNAVWRTDPPGSEGRASRSSQAPRGRRAERER